MEEKDVISRWTQNFTISSSAYSQISLVDIVDS